MEIRNGMSLSHNAKSFRVYFKNMVGLPKNASNVTVLQEIGRIYQENGISEKFNSYMNKFSMVEEHGISLV